MAPFVPKILKWISPRAMGRTPSITGLPLRVILSKIRAFGVPIQSQAGVARNSAGHLAASLRMQVGAEVRRRTGKRRSYASLLGSLQATSSRDAPKTEGRATCDLLHSL